jgi:hypothetical protein
MRRLALAAAAVATFATGAANAAIDIYAAELLGKNECAGPSGGPFVCGGVGDPDGYGGATVMIDNMTNTVSWSIMSLGIGPLLFQHIHAAPAGANGLVIIDFGNANFGSLVDADAASITPASAMNFYVNVHTTEYRPGAIRGQLHYVKTVNPPIPEPGTYAMFALGLAGLALVARRRARH